MTMILFDPIDSTFKEIRTLRGRTETEYRNSMNKVFSLLLTPNLTASVRARLQPINDIDATIEMEVEDIYVPFNLPINW